MKKNTINFKKAFPVKAADWADINKAKAAYTPVSSEKEIVFRKKGYVDPVSGKTGVFETKEKIVDVVNELCLAKTHPEIAAQWYYEKNGILRPVDVAADCKIPVWWIEKMPNGIPGWHIWVESPASRTALKNAAADAVQVLFCDKYPELARELDVEKSHVSLSSLSATSKKRLWWTKTYRDETTGEDIPHSWQATIRQRLQQARAGEAVIRERFNVVDRKPVDANETGGGTFYRDKNARYRAAEEFLKNYRTMDKNSPECVLYREILNAMEENPSLKTGKKMASILRRYYSGSGTAKQIAIALCMSEANFYRLKSLAIQFVGDRLFAKIVTV